MTYTRRISIGGVMTAITPSVERKSHLWLAAMDRNLPSLLVNCAIEGRLMPIDFRKSLR